MQRSIPEESIASVNRLVWRNQLKNKASCRYGLTGILPRLTSWTECPVVKYERYHLERCFVRLLILFLFLFLLLFFYFFNFFLFSFSFLYPPFPTTPPYIIRLLLFLFRTLQIYKWLSRSVGAIFNAFGFTAGTCTYLVHPHQFQNLFIKWSL